MCVGNGFINPRSGRRHVLLEIVWRLNAVLQTSAPFPGKSVSFASVSGDLRSNRRPPDWPTFRGSVVRGSAVLPGQYSRSERHSPAFTVTSCGQRRFLRRADERPRRSNSVKVKNFYANALSGYLLHAFIQPYEDVSLRHGSAHTHVRGVMAPAAPGVPPRNFINAAARQM